MQNKDDHLIFEAYILTKEGIDVPRNWEKKPKVPSIIQPGQQIAMIGHDYSVDANDGTNVSLREIGSDINKSISLTGLIQLIRNRKATLLSIKGKFENPKSRIAHIGDKVRMPGAKRSITIRDLAMPRGINVYDANKIIKHVEQFLADASAEGGGEAENCWTLAIDQAHDLGLEGLDAINTAKYACKELGYPVKESYEPEQHQQHQDTLKSLGRVEVRRIVSDDEILVKAENDGSVYRISLGGVGRNAEPGKVIDFLHVNIFRGETPKLTKVFSGRQLVTTEAAVPGSFPSDMNNPVEDEGESTGAKKLMRRVKELTSVDSGSPQMQQSIGKGAPSKAVPPQSPPIEKEHNGPSYGALGS